MITPSWASTQLIRHPARSSPHCQWSPEPGLPCTAFSGAQRRRSAQSTWTHTGGPAHHWGATQPGADTGRKVTQPLAKWGALDPHRGKHEHGEWMHQIEPYETANHLPFYLQQRKFHTVKTSTTHKNIHQQNLGKWGHGVNLGHSLCWATLVKLLSEPVKKALSLFQPCCFLSLQLCCPRTRAQVPTAPTVPDSTFEWFLNKELCFHFAQLRQPVPGQEETLKHPASEGPDRSSHPLHI